MKETQNTDTHAIAIFNYSKAISSLFLSNMITKLEGALKPTLQNKDKTRTMHKTPI